MPVRIWLPLHLEMDKSAVSLKIVSEGSGTHQRRLPAHFNQTGVKQSFPAADQLADNAIAETFFAAVKKKRRISDNFPKKRTCSPFT